MSNSITTGNNLVIPKTNVSSILSNNSGPHKVFLNVYDLHKSNNYLYPIGTGFFHSGVEIAGNEYCFSMGGVGKIPPRSYDNLGGATFKEQIFIGNFTGNIPQILKMLMDSKFRENTYDLTHQNCNHFTEAFCRALCGKSIPAWVNSASDVSNAVQSSYQETVTLCPDLCCRSSNPQQQQRQQRGSYSRINDESNDPPDNTQQHSFNVLTIIFGMLNCLSSQWNLCVQGKWSYKLNSAMLSSVLVFISFFTFLGHFFTLSWTEGLLDLFFSLSGIAFIGLEYKETTIPAFMLKYIKEELHMLCTPTGRSFLYLLVALILLSQYDNFYYFWVGALMLLVGGLLYWTAKSITLKLIEIKNEGVSEERLTILFTKYDVGTKGYLDVNNLKSFLEELMKGKNISYNEAEAVVSILDPTNDGKVRFEEMSVCLLT